MKPRLPEPSSPIAPHIIAFIRHKRALNRRYDVEDKALRMLDADLNARGITTLCRDQPGDPRRLFPEPTTHASTKLQPLGRSRGPIVRVDGRT
jgi:hypothetical protein